MAQNIQTLFQRMTGAVWGNEKPTKAEFRAAGITTMMQKDINYWWKIFADLHDELVNNPNISEEDKNNRRRTLWNKMDALRSEMGLRM